MSSIKLIKMVILASMLTAACQHTFARYVQADPAGLAAGINLYTYVDGNPVIRIDPMGLMGVGGGGSSTYPNQNPCICPEIVAYQAGIGKDTDGGTEYGHHWTEIGPSESYGYWPNSGVDLRGTIMGVPGSVNRGQSIDPHHGDREGVDTSFTARSRIRPAMNRSCELICEQAKQCIRDFATGYTKRYGSRWSYRFELGDNNCHTFQRRTFDQCELQK